VRLAYGDDVILSPENFHLLYLQKAVPAVEIGKMKDQEVIIVVNVDFGPLIGLASAILDIEGMKVEIVLQELQVLVGRVKYMVPLNGPCCDGFNHKPSRFDINE
jgi:hypothetical protein